MAYRRPLFSGAYLMAGVAALWLGLVAGRATGNNCSGLTDAERATLLSYVRNKYEIPKPVSLRLDSEALVEGTCYRRLTFAARGPLRPFEVTLYLAPDLRFLSTDLLDTHVDPEEADRERNQKLMGGLTGDNSPSIGPATAPVIIVEFGDFECPFCKRAASILRSEIVPSPAGNVRLIFKNFPLAGHPWARTAAEAAACANFQSRKAFWKLHDLIFARQSSIQPGSAKATLLELANSVDGLDMAEYKQCLDDEMSLGVVLRDMNEATYNHVTATPTFFVNGQRLEGFKDASELKDIIGGALRAQALTGAADSAGRAVPLFQ
ncbi:MAG: DsbA family protein [Terriglobia bacterium]